MFVLKNPNYSFDAFEKLSVKSFETHYFKHHAGYVNNLNALIAANDALKAYNLEELIKHCFGKKELEKVFNNAAQHWNHTFFWDSITPNEVKIDQILQSKIEEKYESIDVFLEEFQQIGLNLFGSGWIWIVYNQIKNCIEVIGMEKAETPIQGQNLVPLLVCDVWEHAYYIDFLNDRKSFISCIFSHFNWNFALKNYLYGNKDL